MALDIGSEQMLNSVRGVSRLKYIDRTTLRLSLSYTVVVMAVSLAFSVFFYVTSATALHVSGSTYLLPSNNISGATQLPPKLPSPHKTLSTETAAIEHTLLIRLSLLNGAVLLAGSGICLYLASRTLRPIKSSMGLQERFISDASHELKTPIAGLRLRGEVALRDQGLSLSEAKKTIKENVRQAIVLERLSANLLELAKVSNLQSIASSEVLISDVVQDALKQCRHIAKNKSISVVTDISTETVRGTREQLVRVLVILLDNAIKFSEKGSTIYVTSPVDKREVVISVRDEGQGIHGVDIPHIFERFYQADNSRANQGSGLGLSIAEVIIRQHGGKLTVRSQPGRGSEFTVRIPYYS